MPTSTNAALAYTNIYSDYYHLIFNSIYSKISNYHEAEDICQEVFIRFYEKGHEVENPRKWLMWATHYVLLNYYRKKGRSFEDIEDFYNDVSMSYVNGFKEIRLIIQEALENVELDDDNKEGIIFNLIAVNNYTYDEVAKEVGLSLRQVRYRYSQVNRRIIEYLKNHGIKNLEDLL